jgi:hypothetical protein
VIDGRKTRRSKPLSIAGIRTYADLGRRWVSRTGARAAREPNAIRSSSEYAGRRTRSWITIAAPNHSRTLAKSPRRCSHPATATPERAKLAINSPRCSGPDP